ncbi:MAG: glycosyltransferase, partial [Candidatus Desantisbacteria bacterium]
MRILVLIGAAALGGHVISTLTITKALQSKKHDVILGCGNGILSEKIKGCGIKCINIPFFLSYFKQDYAYFSFLSWITIKNVLFIVKRERIDIIHAFDMPASIIANFVMAITGIPVVTTICGGPGPVYPLPRFQKLIAFSEEYKDVMINKFGWRKENIVVIRNRIDFKENMIEKQEEVYKLGLVKEHKKIILVSRFSGEKVKAVEYVL